MGYYRRWCVKYSVVQAGQSVEGQPIEKYFSTHAEMLAWVKKTTADVMSGGQKLYCVLYKL